MIDIRSFNSLGGGNHGWLDTKHHFSFSDYRDSNRMGWGSLRVWNDDAIASNAGFPFHGHADMEIITYVRTGAITHQDSLGNKGRTLAGDVQVMSAGTGIRHTEYNVEPETTTLFQIWIQPTRRGAAPSWGTKPFPKHDRANGFVPLASGFESDPDALQIQANARVLGLTLNAGESAEYALDRNRYAYLVPAAGSVEINGAIVRTRDGAAFHDETVLKVKALEDTELVLVDAA